MTRLGLLVLSLSVPTGCEMVERDTTCRLVRGLPDGGTAYVLKSDPTVKSSANADFISIGSPDCEDKVCVRDAAFTEVDDGGIAEGYCSGACAGAGGNGCESYAALSCRALILDEATLAAIKASDPVAYERTFGMTTSPYFCARPTGGR